MSDTDGSPETIEYRAGAPEPNAQQRRLIENTDGIYLVDAGAGTGKTFAVTRRYAEIVAQDGVDPADVLLVTFTRSAATEMRERIVDHSPYGLRELADAPISTFHAHCLDVLEEHGHDAPAHLGIDDHVTAATRVVEDELVEGALFREFLGQFRDAHPEYCDRFRAIDDPTELLDLVKELAAKGVFPTREGWYREGESELLGNFETFRERFEERNRPRNGGSKQSELRDDLSGFGSNRTYLPDAPSKGALRGERGTKSVPDWVARDAFDEGREDLAAFVHDVYFAYLEFCLERDVLDFGFLQLFAYVLLREEPALRDRLSHEYVMVDEFQDTSAIQFELALLLSTSDNLCVVGDWKQSIFAFQYADVDNIREFETRLGRHCASLGVDLGGRIGTGGDGQGLPADAVERIELTENYRSTQSILDFSEEALIAPATDGEDVDQAVRDDVVSLSSNAPFDGTTIEAIQHAEEHAAVLAKIQEIVGNDEYAIEDEDAPGDQVPPSYGDVAVLTRTRDYGRELLAAAEEYDVPLAYDGEVELFRTDQAKLLLAWLRILESDADRGWAAVLEHAGYALDEVDHLLETGEYPAVMTDFQATLVDVEDVGAVARRVFDRYGFDGEVADVILDAVRSIHDATTHTRGDLIRFVERAIEDGTTHAVDAGAGEDSVTVQTIHAAKGLEYPIVILANMNAGAFPPNVRDRAVVRYDEVTGLRQRKVYADVEAHPHVYHDWRHDVLRHCRAEGYDEERRLLYVALTRAEHHVVLAAGEEPNAFLEGLPVDVEEGSTDVRPVERTGSEQAQLPFSVEPPTGPIGLTPHDLMDDVFDGGESSDEDGTALGDVDDAISSGDRGIGFGSDLHEYAEGIVEGADPDPPHGSDDERNLREFLEGLTGELRAETPAVLPLEVDGRRVTISGTVDLVRLTPDAVDVIDYKTDRSRRAADEYRKQLSVYHHVLAAAYPDRAVTASVYYTAEDELESIDPLSREGIAALVASELAERGLSGFEG